MPVLSFLFCIVVHKYHYSSIKRLVVDSAHGSPDIDASFAILSKDDSCEFKRLLNIVQVVCLHDDAI